MEIPIAALVFIACVIAIKIFGNPQDGQIETSVRLKLQRWRRVFFAAEVVAFMVLIWQTSGA